MVELDNFDDFCEVIDCNGTLSVIDFLGRYVHCYNFAGILN